MKRFIFLALIVLALTACTPEPTITPYPPTPTITVTPPVSPLPTASPLPTPRADTDAGAVVVEMNELEQEENTMDSELLASVAGIILSLGFSYIPKLSTWYDGLEATIKRLVMAGLLLAAAVGFYGLSCAGVVTGYVECTQAGLVSLVGVYIQALIANQATYLISPKSKK